ncbi:MAG: thioredoxin domain-containing protein [Janthinobacterium lividum]
MSNIVPNRLASASSAYLRSAMQQPVQWHPWSAEAFAQAAAEDKPILLDIGAVWCHWCHVMDRESYEDADTAELINQHFVAIKVDRDERPDIDTRYQAAVSAISGQGGWPLTAFLTPDGRPFFGGTYFPPEERYGQPSFRRVLATMAASFRDQREDVNESAGSVMEAIEYSETFTGDPGDLEQSAAGIGLLDRLVESACKQHDPLHGGFGSQPKFPHAGALNMLLDAASRPGPNAEDAQKAALSTLQKMARGGIFDQLAGGFHRYSVDERWVVPHFEKMSYDNAELLGSYVHGFQTFADPACAQTAMEIMRWMDSCLTDRERGGFYASQDADLSLDDDGDYFTWTQAEAAAILGAEELKLVDFYFDLGAVGDMKHDPSRNVLHRPMSLEQAASRAGVEQDRAAGLLQSATSKLQAARLLRAAPVIDRTVYTSWNGMCISAYVKAGRVLRQPAAIAFAQKSLDRVLGAALHEGQVRHVLAYADPAAPNTDIQGVLDDYVFLAHACLDVWEATGEAAYYQAAVQLGDTLLARFYDGRGGGFFDTAPRAADRVGALQARRKPVQDAPTPAGNSAGAALLLRLHALTDNEVYRDNAQETLECFAGVVEHLGLYASSFGLALGQLARPAVQVVIVGEGKQAAQLEVVALTAYLVNKTVIRLRRSQLQSLPKALAETLPNLPASDTAMALVCVGHTCQPPVYDAAALVAVLHGATHVGPA